MWALGWCIRFARGPLCVHPQCLHGPKHRVVHAPEHEQLCPWASRCARGRASVYWLVTTHGPPDPFLPSLQQIQDLSALDETLLPGVPRSSKGKGRPQLEAILRGLVDRPW